MRNKIQKSMLLVICITLLATFLLLSTAFYMESLNNMQEEVRQEATYVQKALEIAGIEYLESMDKVQTNTRMTLINSEGEVVYDSEEEQDAFENHAARKEVKEAFQNGTGEAIRVSETVEKRAYYYAVLLENGMVLRASKPMDSLMPRLLRTSPYMLGIAAVMVVLAYFLAKWQTARLIAPINALDPVKPLENEVYEELKPLLVSIDGQNRAKEDVANMRKEFSANVSHELKTPLTSISGYAEIMKSGLVKQEDMIAFSERIYNEASRLIVLIEDIIKLSKLDEENIELEKEMVDLYTLSQEICQRLSLPAMKRNVQVELSGESVSYYGVRQMLDEMIFNICENAIKYNVNGGKVNVWVGNTAQGIKVIVEDTGIGIPEDQQERIFERFFRVDKSHSKETGGTGLGLSIVKHGAMYHHAEIHVESTMGKGTKMEILFTNCF